MTLSADIVVAQLGMGSTAILSIEERLRATRFIFERDRRRFIARRTLLRELLAQRLGTRAAAIELKTGPHGKPGIPDCDLHFSMSHCEDLAVFAFATGRRVGIDVERVIPSASEESVPEDFLHFWTQREALAKATGRGITQPDASLDGWIVEHFAPAPGFVAAVVSEHR